MALQSSTECNSYSLFSDILVFLYVFVIVYLNYEFHDICVFGNLRPLFSPRWGGGGGGYPMHNVLFGSSMTLWYFGFSRRDTSS